jgi:hypothetical protein
MKKIALIIVFLSSPAWGFTKFDVCEIHGFFQGNNEEFLSDLSSFYLYEDGFIVDSQCNTLRLAGFKTARKGMENNRTPWTKSELEIIKKMNLFKKKVIASILESSSVEVTE